MLPVASLELKPFICFFCEGRFADRHCLTRHQDTCRMRSTALHSLFGHPLLPHHQEHTVSENQSEKRNFLDYFNIISVGRAEARRRNCTEQVVCDVIVVDDSDDDESPAESGNKLVTSKGENFKRISTVYQKNGVAVKRGNDIVATSRSAQKLFRIDVSSPLGQRLRDHIHSLKSNKCDASENERKGLLSNNSRILNNVELRSSSSSFVRGSPFHSKLRHSGIYPVTFRSSRQTLYSHTYKFTSRQRKEFCRVFDSGGLNFQARRLLRRMKPCRVQLQKLPPTLPTTYSSSLLESSCQNRLILRIQKAAVSLTKSDYPVDGGTMAAGDDCELNTPIVSDLSLNENSTRETDTVCPSQEVSSASNTAAAATLASSVSVTLNANDDTDCHIGDSSDNGVSVTTEMQNCFDLPAEAAEPSVAEQDPTTSANSVKLRPVETSDKDCQTDDDTNWRSSMTELSKSVKTSMSDLPALSFFCNICANVIDCEFDVKSLILEHYAGHGITNIDLVEETSATGEKVRKFIELPAVAPNTNMSANQATTSSISVDELRSRSIMVQPSSSQTTGGIVTSARRTQKKRRRVTWADEVYNTLTPEHQPSPPCHIAAYQDAADLSPSQPTHDGSLPSDLCNNNNVNTHSPSAALSTTCCAVDSNLSSVTVDESVTFSVPVLRSEELSTTVRYPCAANAACERARVFWSKSSLREPTLYGDMFTQLSTALRLQSNPASSDMIRASSTSSLGRAWHDSTDCVICLD